MQHKGLFAAMMAGALVLASCIKNNESQSVTNMRAARADEIRSQAELNRANAQAAITMAEAQATIAAAQAQLLQAQADIAQAEAAKLAIEAELAAVEVEIAKVKLEEEKIKLQAKRAELEALKAKYEAEIAKYQADKQEALNRMAKAQMQAEIDEIKMQQKLLEQEEELLEAIKALEAEKQTQITYLWNKYAEEMTALTTAQKEYIKATAQLAQLEAGEESAEEYLLEQMDDLEILMAAKKEYIEQLKDNLMVTKPEFDAMMLELQAELSKTYTEELQAATAVSLIRDQLFAKEAATMAYEQGWFDSDGFISKLNELAPVDDDGIYSYNYMGNRVNLFYKGEKLNEETHKTEVGIWYYYESGDPLENYATSPVFVPLYTKQANWRRPYRENVYTYPASIDGVVPGSGYTYDIYEYIYSPAKIYINNIEQLVDHVASIKQELNASEVEEYQEYKAYYTQYIQQKMSLLEEEMKAQKAYVVAAYDDVSAAYAAIVFAYAAETEANLKWDVAYDNYYHYIDLHQPTEAAINEAGYLAQYNIAQEDLAKFQAEYEKAYVAVYGTPKNAAGTAEAGNDAVEGLIDKVKRLEAAAYQAGLAAAEKKVAKDQKEAEMTEANKDNQLVDAITTAKSNLATQQEKVAKANDDVNDLLVKFHYAEVVYKGDPTEANQTAMNEAQVAWQTAVTEYETENAKLPALVQAVTAAEAAWAAVKDPYDLAVQAYTEANNALQELLDKVATAKAELGDRKDEILTTAYGRLNIAKEILETAQSRLKTAAENLETAQKNNPDDNTELNQLRMAWHEAGKACAAAYDAYLAANDNYSALFYGENAKYPEFWNYFYHNAPGYSVYFPEMIEYTLEDIDFVWDEDLEWGPGQNYARYEWYGDMLTIINERYDSYIENSEYTELAKSVQALKDQLAVYAAEEEAYVAFVEQYAFMYEAFNEAKKVYVDAKNAMLKLEAQKKALVEMQNAAMYSADGETAVNLEEYEKIIASAEQELIRLEKTYQELLTELYLGPRQRDGEYLFAKITALENKIDQLHKEIVYHQEMIDYYLELLSELLGYNAGGNID